MEIKYVGTSARLKNYDENPLVEDITLSETIKQIEKLSLENIEDIELRINRDVSEDKIGWFCKDLNSDKIFYWIHFRPSAPKG